MAHSALHFAAGALVATAVCAPSLVRALAGRSKAAPATLRWLLASVVAGQVHQPVAGPVHQNDPFLAFLAGLVRLADRLRNGVRRSPARDEPFGLANSARPPRSTRAAGGRAPRSGSRAARG
jgi:hypothetical protein